MGKSVLGVVMTPERKCWVQEFNGDDLLHQLQEAVGGYIETVPCRCGLTMVVDEEGLLKNKPFNVAASCMSKALGGIVGDAVMLDVVVNADGEMDLIGLTPEKADSLCRSVASRYGYFMEV